MNKQIIKIGVIVITFLVFLAAIVYYFNQGKSVSHKPFNKMKIVKKYNNRCFFRQISSLKFLTFPFTSNFGIYVSAHLQELTQSEIWYAFAIK